MSQLHALIIEDNPRNIDVLARLLARCGVTSTQVMNPQQLDAVLDSVSQVDIAFVDLELPGMDGYEILAKLKDDPRVQSAPIVAVTVHVSEINVAHQHGFHSFIGKPLDANRFQEQLDRILSGDRVWETA